MRKKLIYVYFINLLFYSIVANAQNTPVVNDSIRQDDAYGLRIGLDLQNLVTTATNPYYRGFELMGDFRVSKNKFIAVELGNQKKTFSNQSITTTTNGSYIKLGLDHNAYKNLIGLRNVIFVGLRYGYANFSQSLDEYSIATQDNFFGVDTYNPQFHEDNLSAHWAELIAGLKVEVFNNLYLGFSVSLQRNLGNQNPIDFDNLYIPGYGTTNDYGDLSAGYRYFIEYFIPIFKKNHSIKEL